MELLIGCIVPVRNIFARTPSFAHLEIVVLLMFFLCINHSRICGTTFPHLSFHLICSQFRRTVALISYSQDLTLINHIMELQREITNNINSRSSFLLVWAISHSQFELVWLDRLGFYKPKEKSASSLMFYLTNITLRMSPNNTLKYHWKLNSFL